MACHHTLNEELGKSRQNITELHEEVENAKMKVAENMEKGFDRARDQVLLYPALDQSSL